MPEPPPYAWWLLVCAECPAHLLKAEGSAERSPQMLCASYGQPPAAWQRYFHFQKCIDLLLHNSPSAWNFQQPGHLSSGLLPVTLFIWLGNHLLQSNSLIVNETSPWGIFMPSCVAVFGLSNLHANITGIRLPNQTQCTEKPVGMVSSQEDKTKNSQAIPPARGLLASPQGAKPVPPTPTYLKSLLGGGRAQLFSLLQAPGITRAEVKHRVPFSLYCSKIRNTYCSGTLCLIHSQLIMCVCTIFTGVWAL